MLFPLFDALRVQYCVAYRLMRFQWLDPADEHLRPALEHGRDLVLIHQPHRALVDFENLPPLSLQDQTWLSVHWLPQLARQQLHTTALVMRPEHAHNRLAVEAMFWVARHIMRIEVRVFGDVTAGLDWLTSSDTEMVARLCAEWRAAPGYQRPACGLVSG